MRVVSVRDGTEPDEIGLRVSAEPSSRTVTLEGELDLASTDRFAEAIEPFLGGGGPVTVDVEALQFMDSSGLRAVIQAARRAETLVLRRPRGQVEQLLRLCDLERLDTVRIEDGGDG
jgi:anti-anti-sigma factor